MRKLMVFMVVLASFGVLAQEGVAEPVKLTGQQVENVCGKKLKTEPSGVSGCTKDCGANNEQSCEFGCYKGGCWGSCITCARARSAFFPNLYSSRIVRRALRDSQ